MSASQLMAHVMLPFGQPRANASLRDWIFSGRLSAASSWPIERSVLTSIWLTRTTETCVTNLPRNFELSAAKASEPGPAPTARAAAARPPHPKENPACCNRHSSFSCLASSPAFAPVSFGFFTRQESYRTRRAPAPERTSLVRRDTPLPARHIIVPDHSVVSSSLQRERYRGS